MSRNTSVVLLAGTALGLGSAAFGQASLDDSRAISAERLSDAATRTSFLQGAAGAPTIYGTVQFAFHLNNRDQPPGGDEDLTMGFQTRRTQIGVKGKVPGGGDKWGYNVRGGFNRAGGGFGLELAYMTYAFEGGWEAQWGQFKLPVLREENVSGSKQLAGDRSVVNETFNQDYSQGVMFTRREDEWSIALAFSDGLGTRNTDFNSPAEADYAFTARGQYKWAGEWDRFEDFTSWQNASNAGMAGVSIHYQDGGETGGPTSDVSVLLATADVSYESAGWNVFAALIWNMLDPQGADSTNDFGIVVQGGKFIDDSNELFARYDIVIPDGDRANDDPFSTITVGWNHYIIPESHAAKFTLDLQWFLDELAQSIVTPNTGIGLLSDTGDSQFNIRAILSFMY